MRRWEYSPESVLITATPKCTDTRLHFPSSQGPVVKLENFGRRYLHAEPWAVDSETVRIPAQIDHWLWIIRSSRPEC